MCMYVCMYVCMYIGFKTSFYFVRHLGSIASYLPTGLHLGFVHGLPYAFHPVFLRSSSCSHLFRHPLQCYFGESSFCHCLNMAVPCKLVLFNFFYNCFLQSNLLFYSYISNSFFSWYSRGSPQGIHLCSFDPSFIIFCEKNSHTNTTLQLDKHYTMIICLEVHMVQPCSRWRLEVNFIPYSQESQLSVIDVGDVERILLSIRMHLRRKTSLVVQSIYARSFGPLAGPLLPEIPL